MQVSQNRLIQVLDSSSAPPAESPGFVEDEDAAASGSEAARAEYPPGAAAEKAPALALWKSALTRPRATRHWRSLRRVLGGTCSYSFVHFQLTI